MHHFFLHFHQSTETQYRTSTRARRTMYLICPLVLLNMNAWINMHKWSYPCISVYAWFRNIAFCYCLLYFQTVLSYFVRASVMSFGNYVLTGEKRVCHCNKLFIQGSLSHAYLKNATTVCTFKLNRLTTPVTNKVNVLTLPFIHVVIMKSL
jgi:hypothetical protein